MIDALETKRKKLFKIQDIFSKVSFTSLVCLEAYAFSQNNFDGDRILALSILLGALSHAPKHIYLKAISKYLKTTLKCKKHYLKADERLEHSVLQNLYPKAKKYNGDNYTRLFINGTCIESCRIFFNGGRSGTLIITHSSEKPSAMPQNSKLTIKNGYSVIFVEDKKLYISTSLEQPHPISPIAEGFYKAFNS